MEDAPERISKKSLLSYEPSSAGLSTSVATISACLKMPIPPPSQYNALGMMRPHTTAGIVVEARQARMLDDIRGGPLTEHAIAASIAASSIDERGWGDKTLEEVAEEDLYLVEPLLAYDVLLGRMDVEEAIAILANSEMAFRRAHELRESRLRGGPLTPNP